MLPAQVVDATQALNRSAGVANRRSLAWSFVELPSHFVELGLRVRGQVSPLRQVPPQQTVGVLIGTTLPRTLRIAEVNVDVGHQRQAPMVRKLLAAVPGQRLIERQTRYVTLAKVANKDTQTVVSALIKQAKTIPNELYAM